MKRIILLTLVILLSGLKGISQEILETDYRPKINFEDTSLYKYIQIDTNNVWSIDTVTKDILFLSGNNNTSIITYDNYYYGKNINSFFQFKILLGDADRYDIRFEHKFDFEANKDGGMIEISHDNGANWENVLFDSIIQNNITYMVNMYANTDSIKANNNEPGFTGLQDEKLISSFTFSSINLRYDTILLRFRIISDSIDSQNEGWLLDNFVFNGFLVGTDNSQTDSNALLLYPNPVSNTVNLKIQNKIINQVEIYSITGQLILYAKNQNILNIDISDLNPGIYYLKCKTTDDETLISKFIKQ